MNNKISKNAFFNMIYQGLNVIFPLLSSLYVARILIPELIGRVSFAQNIVFYFISFASLGINTYGIREIAKCNNDKILLKKTTSEILKINIISNTIFCIIYFTFIFITPFFAKERLLYFIVGLQLIFNSINTDWFFGGTENYAYVMKRSFIIKILSFIALILFVKEESHYVIYALINSLALGLNYFFNIYKIKNYINLFIDNKYLKERLKPIFVFFATLLSQRLYMQVDTTMLGIISGERAVGLYTYPSRIMLLSTSCITAISAVILAPLVKAYKDKNLLEFKNIYRKCIIIILIFSIPLTIIYLFKADFIIKLLFNEKYYDSINTLRILSPQVLLLSLEDIYAARLLIAIEKEKWILFTTSSGAIINVLLNFFLIKKYAQDGVALASTITIFFIFILEVVIYYISIHKITNKNKFII
ncbi:MAG: flippase [Eubacteriales bacterium]|nr:flippase [Eubacteriales bacterium]